MNRTGLESGPTMPSEVSTSKTSGGRPRTSTRNPEALRGRLARWLGRALGPDSHPSVSIGEGPASTGMSSETILLDASWREGGVDRVGAYVVRLPPAPDAYPVFPHYDFARQVRAMRLVRERSAVPVPRIAWYEPDPAALGAPFFVMERVEGLVPPDVMPYVFESWLSKAPTADQARLQRNAVRILVGVHGVRATGEELAFLEFDQPGDTALRRHFSDQKAYYAWLRAGRGFDLIERMFAWLEARWPTHASGATLCWGDARIGNVLWRDFEPAAVLDWESVALAPREVDLGWLIFFHRYFQDYADQAQLPGMPGFLRRDDVAATYAEESGYEPRELEWYLAYAALRQALVSIRVSGRRVHFGEQPEPADPQDLIMHRGMLDRILEGSQIWT